MALHRPGSPCHARGHPVPGPGARARSTSDRGALGLLAYAVVQGARLLHELGHAIGGYRVGRPPRRLVWTALASFCDFQLEQLIERLALRRPRLSSAAVYREVAGVAAARGWTAPSYATVYSVIRGLDPALVTLAHQGSKVYADRFDLLYRREASRSNELWQADHTELDVRVLDEHGRPARPWLTVILDDFSRAVAGYALSRHAPSSIQTALALRQAIWRKGNPHWSVCSIPETFYSDHGSDFTSHHLEQVAADLHMPLVFSTAGTPRGRGKVERILETVNQRFLSHQPGYTPAGSAPAKAVLTPPELDARLRMYFVETYHQQPHSQTGVPSQARWEADGSCHGCPGRSSNSTCCC